VFQSSSSFFTQTHRSRSRVLLASGVRQNLRTPRTRVMRNDGFIGNSKTDPSGTASADDVRMSEPSMPESLETIAAKIDALSKSSDERFGNIDRQFAKVDQQFARVDQQFATIDGRFAETRTDLGAEISELSKSMTDRFGKIDRQFEETKAQLGVKIEAVDAKVDRLYDEVIAMRAETKRNTSEHEAFTKRLENHDLRILALEQPGHTKP
jgi:hypothetical protein